MTKIAIALLLMSSCQLFPKSEIVIIEKSPVKGPMEIFQEDLIHELKK